MNYYFAFALTLFSAIPEIFAQKEWHLKINNDGIKVYNLKSDTSKLNELKVVTELNGSIKAITQVILAVAKHPEWVYGTKSSYTLLKISDSEVYFYKEIKSPAPLSNRDLVAHLQVIEQSATKTIIRVKAMPNYAPEKRNLVRVPFLQETWVITGASIQKSKVEYYLKVDPGGYVPPMLANLFASKGPYESFKNLKQVLDKSTSARDQFLQTGN